MSSHFVMKWKMEVACILDLNKIGIMQKANKVSIFSLVSLKL